MTAPRLTLLPAADPAAIRLLPSAWAVRHRVVPLALRNGELEVGVDAPPPAATMRRLSLLTGKIVRPVALPSEALESLIKGAYPAVVRMEVEGTGVTAVERVQQLISRAIDRRASDIHIEPAEDRLRVRFRIDGVLVEDRAYPVRGQEEVISRLKILAGMDIAERRRPQDGRFRFGAGAAGVDVRVASLPASGGEKLVLRLLDRGDTRLDLPALGFTPRDLQSLREALALPNGLLLVTGPTGSGKTTTLYAALQTLNTPEVNIVTVEDPIEYRLPGVVQTQAHPEIGYTFATALRAFLRQDPDILLVGEIRDAETAELAVRAALTGHLVLSTLHTNDAVSSIGRLFDLGVSPFLVASCLRMVVAQRLVRTPCFQCRSTPTTGCPTCTGTGFYGRTALVETLSVSEPIARLIAAGETGENLREAARKAGMTTLREAAREAVAAGRTTPEEARRETNL